MNCPGEDRAGYGDSLLTELAKRLTELKVSNCNRGQLYRYLRFYRLYPEIVGTLSPQLRIPPDKIMHKLSYSHLELIVDLDEDFPPPFPGLSVNLD